MRMIPVYRLNAEDVRQMMLAAMEKHLSLKTEDYRSSTQQTFDLRLKTVAEGSSLAAVCADSGGAVDSNTLREQLNAVLVVGALRRLPGLRTAAKRLGVGPMGVYPSSWPRSPQAVPIAVAL